MSLNAHVSQAEYGRMRGYSKQYIGQCVRDGVIQLTPDRKIDPESADAGLSQNRGGTMRVSPHPRRAAQRESRVERLRYAVNALLVSAATAHLHLELRDPARAEDVLRMILADGPKILDGTFSVDD